MFEYKIESVNMNLSKEDEEILIIFLKMLDFSAEYLSSIYDATKIKFYPELKKIAIYDLKKHQSYIEEVAKSYGITLEN